MRSLDRDTKASVSQHGTEGASHVYPVARILSSQSVAIGASSVQSAAINARTVRLCSKVDVYIAFGDNPVATSASILLPAGAVEYFQIDKGSKIACLRVSTDGALSVSAARI
jgi:hypothetical protein